MSTQEEKNIREKQTENSETIGIKMPWWIAYPILIILISVLLYIMYRCYIFSETKEVSVEAPNLPVKISCNENIIGVGEQVNISIENKKENTYLLSSNPEIINIENNMIIGVTEGEADIYAITEGQKSNEIHLICEVKLEKIELSETEIEMYVEETKELNAIIVPENATHQNVTWESLNPKVATIDNGIIKGISEGETQIIVSSEDGKQQANCKVKVKIINVQSISIDDTNVTLGIGQSYIIRATVNPNNATYNDIIWTSSNQNVVTVKNGKVQAKSAGEAIVTASTKEGKKQNCTFIVTETAPNNTVYYVTEEFNVRSGPGTSYERLDTVSLNDEIEVLKETSSWAKIRIKKNGVVGYTILKAYSTEKKYYIGNVPYINQNSLGYPTGCEAVAATMAAQYAGYNVSVATIVANTPTDTLGKRQETITKEIQEKVVNEETGEVEIKTTTKEETVWVAANPFLYFVGHPTKYKSEGSYGCYAEPIAVSLKASGVPCTNISGCSVDTLYNYIKNGKPVIIWCRARAQDLTEGVTWQYPDGSGEYKEMVGEHCAVLIGVDKDYVYLNDPAVGSGVKQPRGKFESNWYKLYNQAIIIN